MWFEAFIRWIAVVIAIPFGVICYIVGIVGMVCRNALKEGWNEQL